MSDATVGTEDQTQRVSVVTGGALGIGGAISRRLTAAGDHVVMNDIDDGAAHRVAKEIRDAGGTCTVIVGDITDSNVVEELASTAEAIRGRGIDVLINNVGDFRPASPVFVKSTPTQWRRLHDINLGHVLAVTYRLLPAMIAAGRGAIVNVSTVEAYRGIPGNAVYSAYKAGVSAFTKSLAVEVGSSGIRVNAIAPDLADTEQTPAEVMLGGRNPDLVRSWVPLGRFGVPEDYADVVAFLASDDARFVTGQTVPVDGGTLAASGWYGRSTRRGWSNLPGGV